MLSGLIVVTILQYRQMPNHYTVQLKLIQCDANYTLINQSKKKKFQQGRVLWSENHGPPYVLDHTGLQRDFSVILYYFWEIGENPRSGSVLDFPCTKLLWL